MRIGRKRVASGLPVCLVAEIGVNHDGDPLRALKMVRAAARAGADAVKVQAFRDGHLYAPARGRLRQVTGRVQDFFRRVELKPRDFERIAGACRNERIGFVATPFDPWSADMLAEIGVDAFKIASGDITHEPLLAHVARRGRPVVLSTGASTLDEVASAVDVLRRAGAQEIALLHCVSNYPAKAEEINLRAMQTLAWRFGLPVGLSDHTVGTHVALAAVVLGASILEKHFTLDHALPGPDHRISMDPAELAWLVSASREVARAMGTGKKVPTSTERQARRQGRRGLYLAGDVLRGRTLTAQDILILRPAQGLPPGALGRVIGRKAARRLAAGAPLREKDLA